MASSAKMFKAAREGASSRPLSPVRRIESEKTRSSRETTSVFARSQSRDHRSARAWRSDQRQSHGRREASAKRWSCRSHPKLAVGLHLVVVDGRPVLPPSEIPAPRGRTCLPPGPFGSASSTSFQPAARRELAREIRAQLERFRDTGLALARGRPSSPCISIPSCSAPRRALAISDSRDPAAVRGAARHPRARFERARDEARLELDLSETPEIRRTKASGAGVAFSDRVYGLLATGG
jgi:hypothetical protein